MIEFCDDKFPFPLPIIVLTNNDSWIHNVFITDIIPILLKPSLEEEDENDSTPIGLLDIDLTEIELEIPLTPMFNISGECSSRYREDTDKLVKDSIGWHSVMIDNGAFSLFRYGSNSWIPADPILRLQHQLNLSKKLNASNTALILPDFVQEPLRSIKSYAICLKYLKKAQQRIKESLHPITLLRCYLSVQGKTLQETITNMKVLKDLFFNQSEKYHFQLGLSLATREHPQQDAKTIIKEAIDLFLYTKKPAWIHILGEARQEVLEYAQQLSKKVYDMTGDSRRTVFSVDTSVPFFNAKEQLNDIRPVTVASKYRHFWQVSYHDLRLLSTITPDDNYLHLKPSEEFLKTGQHVTRERDLFSCELNTSNLL